MVLTVTLNPLLEHRLYFNGLNKNSVSRAEKENFTAGGKGINVSRQLNKLGIKNQAFTFLGGNNGKQLRRIIASEEIDFSFTPIKSETRRASLIIDGETNTLQTFISPDSVISNDESEEFLSKLKKMIENCSILVLSGSAPPGTEHIFPEAIETANKLDKITILDTYGKHLAECIKKAPMVIHNNASEIEKSLGIKLTSDNEILDHLNYLYSNGIKLGYVTNGSGNAYASKFDFHYKITPPKINEADATGSGDAFTAGIAYGLEKSLVFDEFTSLSAALGAANANSWNTCSVELSEAENLQGSVLISSVGKKMKIIDDSPTI